MEYNPAIVADGSVDSLLLNHIKVEVEMKQEEDVYTSDDSQIHFNSNSIKKEEDLDGGCSRSELVIVERSIGGRGESPSSIKHNPTVEANDSADLLLLNHIKVEVEMKQEVDIHSLDDSQTYCNSNVTVTKEEDLDVGCSPSELVIVQTSPLDESVESVTNIEYAPTVEEDDCVDLLLLNHIKTEVEVKQEVDVHSLDDSQSHYSSNTIKKEENLDRGCSSSEFVIVKRIASIDETGESNFESCARREHLSETLSAYKDNTDVIKLYIGSNSSVGINHSPCVQSNSKSINHTDINNITHCNICLQTISNSQELDIHMKAHKSSKSYECHICNKSFTQLKNLKTHERIHFGIKSYKCGVCEKSFTQSGYLRAHERIHTGIKPFQCRFCEKLLTRSGYLRAHERIHMGSKPYKCSLCEKSFSVSSHLTRHKISHLGIKPYACGSCEKTFTTLHQLKRHEGTHSGNKLFICSFCGKACSRSSDLIKHERIHTGYKPHICTFCEKQFVRSDDLRKHERVHTGSKPYKCSLCDKQFSVSSNLIAHKKIHSGSKPYECSICEKSFSQPGKLRIHKKTHLDIKP